MGVRFSVLDTLHCHRVKTAIRDHGCGIVFAFPIGKFSFLFVVLVQRSISSRKGAVYRSEIQS